MTTAQSRMLIVGPIYHSKPLPSTLGSGHQLVPLLIKTNSNNFVGSTSCSPIPAQSSTSPLYRKKSDKPQRALLVTGHLLSLQATTTTLPINPALTTTTSTVTTTTSATTTTVTNATVTTTSTTTTSTTTTTTAPTTTAVVQMSSLTEANLPVIPTTTSANLDTATPASSGVYDMFLSNGAIHNLGGANFYGSPIHKKTKSPIVAMTSTSYGTGYLLTTAVGNIYNYGNANFYGSPIHKKLRKPLISINATPDGKGYWVVDANGAVYNYGDAPFCGSLVHTKLSSPVVSMAVTPDGKGYWLVTGNGDVYSFGDALNLKSPAPLRLPSPVVSMAVTPDGKGYWLLTAKGDIYNTGDAKFYGSPIHKHFTRPAVSIATSPDGKGYLVTSAKGQVFNYGDAKFHGSLVHKRFGRKIITAGLVIQGTPPPPAPPPVKSLGPAPFAGGLIGNDISNFQCSTPGSSTLSNQLPAKSPITIIEAAGWLDNADNPCLQAEATWATSAQGSSGTPYSLYLFMNAIEDSSGVIASAESGPGGNCPSLTAGSRPYCIAYNYGYNGAEQAFNYAASQGAKAAVWWLDIENAQLSSNNYSNFPTNYWSKSQKLNDETIQGAIDALRSNNITVGIYSTSVQYSTITGNYIPSAPQIPLWVAGAPWTSPPYGESGLPNTSVLQNWCQGTATYQMPKVTYPELFAGGTPWVLQETPGTEVSPYNLDPDFTC
ncbi:MAG: hypothetical protein M1374_00520 [Firmicutes bacterium]|nr:hypothetical protein [Bacillota bacterium]